MSKRKTLRKVDAHSRDGIVVSEPLLVDSGDDETTDIAPALSDHEWAAWRCQRLNPVTMQREVSAFPPNPDALWKTMAIANDQLHDEDPRKFVVGTANMVRSAARAIDVLLGMLVGRGDDGPVPSEEQDASMRDLYSRLYEHCDVIESLLRQEG